MSSLAQIPRSLVAEFPQVVRDYLETLTPPQVMAFTQEFERRRKNKTTCYVLWFFFGLHHVYLERWGLFVLYVLTAGGLGIWALIEIFSIPGEVTHKNADIAVQLAKDFSQIRH